MAITKRPKLDFHFSLPGGATAVRETLGIMNKSGLQRATVYANTLTNPGDAALARFALAAGCLQQNQPDLVLKFLGEIPEGLFEAPRNSLASAAEYQKGRTNIALSLATRAVELDAADANAIKVLIAANIIKGNIADANQALNLLFTSNRVDLSCIELARAVHAALGSKFDEGAYVTKVGLSLINKGRPNEGLPFLQRSNEIDPDNLRVWKGFAAAYRGVGDLSAAEEWARKTVARNEDVESYNILGLILTETCRADEAVEAYRSAVKHDQDSIMAQSNAVMAMHYSPEFSADEIREAIEECARIIRSRNAGKRAGAREGVVGDGPLRVGIVSGHFRRHPAMSLSLPALELLDPEKVQLFAYSNSTKRDAYTRRLQAKCSKWHEVSFIDDDALFDLIQEDQIEVLMDFSGYSGGRIDVVARRPAPVQVKWVGGLYNTSGLSEFDWLLGDEVQVPREDEDNYAEQVYRMPGNYIVYDPPRHVPAVAELPMKANGYVTFGCFNNAPKVNKPLVEMWAAVMAGHDNSHFLLKSPGYDSPEARERVTRWFAECGVDADRIEFRTKSDHAVHMGAYADVDIALDSWPYTGGLTTCEALWMGCPVVTLPAWTFAGRHAATHLKSIGADEWIASDLQDFVRIASGLAEDVNNLAELRAGLRDRVQNSPLCDSNLFAKQLTEALYAMSPRENPASGE